MKIKHLKLAFLILVLVNLSRCELKEKMVFYDLDSRVLETNELERLTIHFLDTTRQQELLNYIVMSYEETNLFFGGEMNSLSVYVDFNSECNATTYVNYNKILLNISDECIGAFVHELIHAHLGLYKEFWFQEGFATYLSRKIKTDSGKEISVDANDLWFSNEVKRDSIVCPVHSIFQDNSIEKIRGFFDITNDNPTLNSSTQMRNYYKLSASFCEYLSKAIGLEKMISISQEEQYSNQSIRAAMRNNDIDLDVFYEKWISNQ